MFIYESRCCRCRDKYREYEGVSKLSFAYYLLRTLQVLTLYEYDLLHAACGAGLRGNYHLGASCDWFLTLRRPSGEDAH